MENSQILELSRLSETTSFLSTCCILCDLMFKSKSELDKHTAEKENEH